MTRRRYERLIRALTMVMDKEIGIRADGRVWMHQRDHIAEHAIKVYGSYQAAWDAHKGNRDLFKFHGGV